ncbi:hypothetical protein B0A49_02466 [Cryomyces minteri]|uniref:Histone-lysine N-methyltransferase, H3 lysine-79 specific n=1 Tax=Cryomyces minteri TaxID=331657 RepID=A0A4U0XA24_9PEZI|nr:hypothetical protein B0A49_02466 [Cryomyces minteri]
MAPAPASKKLYPDLFGGRGKKITIQSGQRPKTTDAPPNPFLQRTAPTNTPPQSQGLPTRKLLSSGNSRPLKRKSETPDDKPLKRVAKKRVSAEAQRLSSEEEDSGDDNGGSTGPSKTGGRTWYNINQNEEDDGTFNLIHSADHTSGPRASKFKPCFEGSDSGPEIELHYPGISLRERFKLVKGDQYDAHEDIYTTVEHICANFLPPTSVEAYQDNSFKRRLIRAHKKESLAEYRAVIAEFNATVSRAKQDGTMAAVVAAKRRLHKDLVQRILDQVYSRTVSPRVELTRAYTNGTDNVYGELHAPFISAIFAKTGLTHSDTFVDLGSGVGNVVLQAALEIGADAWGCEMMANPCELADAQEAEFGARARLWGVDVGATHLLRGDFLDNRQIGDALKRADVVLVNNQAFNPDLNAHLVTRFLDLKEGARVVSLKPFVPLGHELLERNVNDPVNLLLPWRGEELFSGTGAVSWTGQSVDWHVATKDSKRVERFLETLEKGRATRRRRR